MQKYLAFEHFCANMIQLRDDMNLLVSPICNYIVTVENNCVSKDGKSNILPDLF